MRNKLCPKVILEGTCLTVKIEIAFGLNEHPRIVRLRKYRYTKRCTAVSRIILRRNVFDSLFYLCYISSAGDE